MMLNDLFLGESNLEFTLFPQEKKISEKVLYRSHGDTQIFKNKIHIYLRKYTKSSHLSSQIDKIFSIHEVNKLTFHFGEDSFSKRVKFYISLYGIDFKKSLIILSKIKKILGIQEYILEKDFSAFDCIGFDICEDIIHLKVYELYSTKDLYLSFLPSYISGTDVKEIGILKTQKRRKIFFRFKKPLKIDNSFFSTDDFVDINKYHCHGRMTYYCIEKKKEEIYFI